MCHLLHQAVGELLCLAVCFPDKYPGDGITWMIQSCFCCGICGGEATSWKGMHDMYNYQSPSEREYEAQQRQRQEYEVSQRYPTTELPPVESSQPRPYPAMKPCRMQDSQPQRYPAMRISHAESSHPRRHSTLAASRTDNPWPPQSTQTKAERTHPQQHANSKTHTDTRRYTQHPEVDAPRPGHRAHGRGKEKKSRGVEDDC